MIDLDQKYKDITQRVYQLVGKRQEIISEKDSLLQKQEALMRAAQVAVDAKKLLELFVKSTEINLKEYIEPLVNEAISFVFQQQLEFRLLFMERRNQIEIDFIIMRDDKHKKIYKDYMQNPGEYADEFENVVKESVNINYNYGGAINQVLALVLRLLIIELLKIKGTVILDEPTSAVAETYAARVGQLVSNLSRRFNRQYIYITHSTALASYADVHYEVKATNGISTVNLK